MYPCQVEPKSLYPCEALEPRVKHQLAKRSGVHMEDRTGIARAKNINIPGSVDPFVVHSGLSPASDLEMPLVNDPETRQVEADPRKTSEFLSGCRSTSAHSPTLQRMPSVGAPRDTSRVRGRNSLRANFLRISLARRGTVEISGTSCIATGGCDTLGGSMTTKSHRMTPRK